MRVAATLVVALALVLSFWTGTDAGEKGKEVTVKGKITCPKCDLKIQKKCATVVVEKQGDKEIIYYFDQASNKKYHGDICTEAKQGTVRGTVKDEGKKKIISVTSLEYSK